VLTRNSIGTIALAVALSATLGAALAFDESKYPDWKGQWRRADPGPQRGPGGRQPLLLQALALLSGPGQEGIEVDGAQLGDVAGHGLHGRPEADLPLDTDA